MNRKDRTIKPRGGRRSILYIELRSPYPERLKELAEKQHRSAKAQAEVIIMTALDALVGRCEKMDLRCENM